MKARNFIIIIIALILGTTGLTYIFIKTLENNHMYYQKETDKMYKEGYEKGFINGEEKVKQIVENKLINSFNNADKDSIEYFISMENKLDKLMDISNPKLTKEKKLQYKKYIMLYSNKYNLSPLLIAGIIHRETNFREHLVSPVKARGPMQVMAKWHKNKLKKLGLNEMDLHSINHGIHVGCLIISEYIKQVDGNYRLALYKYVGVIKNTKTSESYVKDIFSIITRVGA